MRLLVALACVARAGAPAAARDGAAATEPAPTTSITIATASDVLTLDPRHVPRRRTASRCRPGPLARASMRSRERGGFRASARRSDGRSVSAPTVAPLVRALGTDEVVERLVPCARHRPSVGDGAVPEVGRAEAYLPRMRSTAFLPSAPTSVVPKQRPMSPSEPAGQAGPSGQASPWGPGGPSTDSMAATSATTASIRPSNTANSWFIRSAWIGSLERKTITPGAAWAPPPPTASASAGAAATNVASADVRVPFLACRSVGRILGPSRDVAAPTFVPAASRRASRQRSFTARA
jgi:hypothetical protein